MFVYYVLGDDVGLYCSIEGNKVEVFEWTGPTGPITKQSNLYRSNVLKLRKVSWADNNTTYSCHSSNSDHVATFTIYVYGETIS